MEQVLEHFMQWLGMPSVGLPAVFISSLVSATLIPVGSEPMLFAYISVNADLYWAAIVVATAGNTIGGMVDWWLGLVARNTVESLKGSIHNRMQKWLEERGPKMLLLAWLPGVGDPLCLAAGWLRLPWLQCMVYMATGKFLRYVTATWFLMLIPNSFWRMLAQWLHLPLSP